MNCIPAPSIPMVSMFLSQTVASKARRATPGRVDGTSISAPGDGVHAEDRADVYELVELARRGDRVAFAALYDRYYDRVHRFIVARAGAVVDAEDVAAEAFIGAWKGLGSFSWSGARFSTWLFAIAQRQLAMALRTHVRRHSKDDQMHDVAQGGDAAGVGMSAPHAVGAEAEYHNVELRMDVSRALACLNERQRQVIALRFYADMTTDDVAAVMGEQPATVRQLQLRALDRLRMQQRRERAA